MSTSARSWSAPQSPPRGHKGSYLKDKFHRLKARRGAMRAALAIAHKILVSAYHMLAKGLPYRDLGEAYLDQISEPPRVCRRLFRLSHAAMAGCSIMA
jgi:hypothetical protein